MRTPDAPASAPPLRGALRPALLGGYGVGFLLLFAFIGVFSYVNFVLMHPPLGLSMMSLGLIYFVFAPSIIATPLAGSVASRLGARNALFGGLAVAGLGLWLLASSVLAVVIAGMVLVGLGAFFAQATATGQVSRTAGAAKSVASGLYLAAYFAGGLTGAAVIGAVFERANWNACLWIVAVALAGCAVLGLNFDAKQKAAQ